MPEKLISGWPEGTKKINKPDGEEIILPKATDMNKFSREEIAERVRATQSLEEKKVKLENPQFSANKEKYIKTYYDEKRKFSTAPKRVPRRQEQIQTNRNKGRNFREEQKENGAKNYEKIWEDKISL